MTVHTIGDSHAKSTFEESRNSPLPGVSTNWIGPVTMSRVGHVDDDRLFDIVTTKGDSVIFCFGEIDVRCHVKNFSRPTKSSNDYIQAIVSAYVDRLAFASKSGWYQDARLFIMSVVPPIDSSNYVDRSFTFPIVGTNEERVQFTDFMNLMLREHASGHGIEYIDMNTPFRDGVGLIRSDLSDGGVHIKCPTVVSQILESLRLTTKV